MALFLLRIFLSSDTPSSARKQSFVLTFRPGRNFFRMEFFDSKNTGPPEGQIKTATWGMKRILHQNFQVKRETKNKWNIKTTINTKGRGKNRGNRRAPKRK